VGGLLGGLDVEGVNAIPLSIEDSMVSSLDVVTTREGEWDRFVIVLGFWAWRTIASPASSAERMGG
jgi:hypothetical protein